MASAGGERLSSSDFKKKREIEEARKNGTLPPEQDADGNLINPHNPTMSHKTNECVERPRKVGAWKTNQDLKSDDVVVDVRSEKFGKLAFDAKRDQWLGYDPKDHSKTVEASADKKKEKKTRTKAKDKEEGKSNSDSDSDSDYESDMESEDEEFRDHDEGPMFTERVARQGGVGGAQMKTTVRNLRIREDTAKYLRNLNPNSAYYDPKTRSMRDNPNPELNPEDTTFVGDNTARFTGDAQKLASAQLFAWEAYSKGTDIHPLANPSQAEFLKNQYEERKAALEKEKSRKILDKYGELLLAQSEHYVEYSRDGRVVKGRERAPVRSKYVEDAFEKTTLHLGLLVRKSYCTGEDGKKAIEDSKMANADRPMLKVPEKLEPARPMDRLRSGWWRHHKRSEMYGENIAPELDEKKLKKAIKKAAKEKKKQAEQDDKKRKYNSTGNYEVNAEEMEAYKLLKSRGEDPMAKVLGNDVLLDEDEGKGKRARR
ncbi:Pre-mRNA splicing Prp18-interacting factor [Phytophthora cactorum]|nr:Pre-mRNA splicing Prp18-interacting factor [Phytophthora cactorum]